MEQYLINDTTLSAIGDALRNKTGETKIEIIEHIMPYVISKTPNAISFTERNGGYENHASLYDIVTFPGATKIKVKMAYQTESIKYDWVQVASGKITSMPSTVTKYGDVTLSQVELEFDNTDTITFYFKSDSSNGGYLGYYAECTGYDADGNAIDCIMQEEKEVPNVFLPTEMPVAINNLGVIPLEGYNVTGDCANRFTYNAWNWYIEGFGDKIKTSNITNIQNMFGSSDELIKIPFDINMNIGSSYHTATNMFNICKKLKMLPRVINMKPNNLNSIFNSCNNLREIPESFYDTWDWSYVESLTNGNAGNRSSAFHSCYSLRKIPMNFLRHVNPNANYNYSIYNGLVVSCHTLDEVLNLPIPYIATWTSNAFSGTFNYCYRLKNMTFETNEDGTPKVVKWKSQTIDLTSQAGYSNAYGGDTSIINYNSGITADKYVNDDASYQALKNDPDWYSSMKYSRYNHDSAVATINSLPDASAYLASAGGTNTIKFTGAAGEKTDGGAISNLTAEEIAVATAKGWTVTLV